jgi:hypothetical protein
MQVNYKNRSLLIVIMILTSVCLTSAAALADDSPVVNELAERLSLSGAVEVEVGYSSADLREGDSEESSDIVTATAELDIVAAIAENVEGTIIFLWEEGESEGIGVDEAFISLGEFSGFSVTAGLFALPFGNFNSYMVSDPPTVDLGETYESAVQFSYSYGDVFEAAAGLFNGDVDKRGKDDLVDNFYAAFIINPIECLYAGASYISDIADSDLEIAGSMEDLDKGDGEAGLEDIVGGFSVFLSFNKGIFGLEAEYLGALGEFDEADLDADGDGSGDTPAAWNIEAAVMLMDEKLVLAVGYRGTAEMADMPETLILGAASYELFDNTAVSAEISQAEYDEEWSETDTETSATVQLAVAF